MKIGGFSFCDCSLYIVYICGMRELRLSDWLPTTRKEVKLRGWETLDVILFSGDAYVDHPSFGPAVIGRLLESYGLKVAIVPQPSVHDSLQDFTKLGKPRLFFGVTSGVSDDRFVPIGRQASKSKKILYRFWNPLRHAGARIQ